MTEGVGTGLRGIISSTAPLAQMTPAANHAAARSGRLGDYPPNIRRCWSVGRFAARVELLCLH